MINKNEKEEEKDSNRIFFIKLSNTTEWFSILGLVGFILIWIWIAGAILYFKNEGDGRTLGECLHTYLNNYQNTNENKQVILFAVAITTVIIGSVGTTIVSIGIYMYKDLLINEFNVNIKKLALVSVFLGIFVGTWLAEKLKKVLDNKNKKTKNISPYTKLNSNNKDLPMNKKNSFNLVTNLSQQSNSVKSQNLHNNTNISNKELNNNSKIVDKNDDNFNKIDQIQIKLTNLEIALKKITTIDLFLKKGLISQKEYFNLKEKIISES